MRTFAALLGCLFILLEAGGAPPSGSAKSSGATAPAYVLDDRADPSDCAASAEAAGGGNVLAAFAGLGAWQEPQQRGRNAQRGDKLRGAVVKEGPGFVTINPRCSKARRPYCLWFCSTCVNQPEDLVTFRGSFDQREQTGKDCCDRKLVYVIQN